ncbi:MAG: hypothetical protein ACRYFK_05810 [Janthinobacterium lividum]
MKKFTVSALLAGVALLAATSTQAQTTAPDFPTSASATARPPAKPAPDAARMRRQQQMSPEDAARDQQLQIMEARTGNTSFGMAKAGPSSQQDKASGSFRVLRFRELRGQEQQRGETRRVQMGARTTGKPLKQKKHKFLFF